MKYLFICAFVISCVSPELYVEYEVIFDVSSWASSVENDFSAVVQMVFCTCAAHIYVLSSTITILFAMSVRWIPRDEAVAIVDEWKSADESRSRRLEHLSSILRSQLRTQYQHIRLAHICFLRDAADMLERVVPYLQPNHMTSLCRVACFCGSIRCALVLASNGAFVGTLKSFSCVEILASARPLRDVHHEDVQQLVMVMQASDPEWMTNAINALHVLAKRSGESDERARSLMSHVRLEVTKSIAQ